MFRVVIVAAVSTTAQATDDKASIPQQVEACREVCEARGWRVAATIEIPGHSRNYNWLHEIIRDCPEYGELVRRIESDQIDLLVCRDYDRLWRTDALRAQVMALCREHSVQVFSLNQPIEPISPDLLAHTSDSHLIMEAISGVVSEMENRARVRRMVQGKEARARRGIPLYSNNHPYGYKPGNDGIPQVHETQAVWLRWMFERRALDRWSYQHIARHLTHQSVPTPKGAIVWWPHTVELILANPFYIGHVHWGKAYCTEGKHERLISEDVWQRAQQVKQEHAHYVDRSSQRNVYALSGLMRCGLCGHAMTYNRDKSRLGIRCSYYLSTHGKCCVSNWQRAEPIEAYVLERAQAAIRAPERLLEERRKQRRMAGVAEELSRVEKAITDLDARWEVWNHDHEIGAIGTEEMLTHRQRLLGQKESLIVRKGELEARLSVPSETSVHEVIQELTTAVDVLPRFSPTDLRRVYVRLIRRVELRRGDPPLIFWL